MDLPDTTSRKVLHGLLDRYSISPHRKMGQNFLVDANIATKIIRAMSAGPRPRVIEVGPGAGALTTRLAAAGARVMAIEIDRGLIRLLESIFLDNPGITILEADALSCDWGALTEKAGHPVSLVSNLPYNISGPFIYSLFEAGFPFAEAILMLQKEVALRLAAKPGNAGYGSMSAIAAYYSSCRLLFDVSRNVFWPRPKVDSAVVRLLPCRGGLTPGEEALLHTLVRGVFLQRRKTISNSMTHLFPAMRSEVNSLLAKAGIDPGIRPEQLSAAQFAKLARITYNCSSKLC